MKRMMKKLALAMAVVTAVGTVPLLPSAWAKTSDPMEIVCFQELPEEILYQQVAYGTKKRSLNLPRYLYAEIREVDEDTDGTDDMDDTGAAVTATPSDASMARRATASNAEKKISANTDTEADSTAAASDRAASAATPSNATSSDAVEDDTGDWKRIRVNWVLNESFSEQEEYDGEVPGIYVFEAEPVRDRYACGDGELPQIEVEVLEKEEEAPEIEVPETEAEMEPFAWETVIDGVQITLTADPGVFPEDAEVLADRVEEDTEDSGNADQAVQAVLAESAADGAPAMEISKRWLFDIRVQDGDGETIQPDQSAGNAELTFTLMGTGDDDIDGDTNDDTDDAAESIAEEVMFQLFSMERDGSEVKVLSDPASGNTLHTEMDRFSLYSLVKLQEVSGRYAARIGDTGYETVEAAVQSVADGGKATIVMTGDSKENVSIRIDGSRQIVLDLAGYTLTGPEDASAMIVDGPDASLTLTDSSDGKTGIVRGRAGGVSTQDGAAFVMAGGAVGR